MSVRIVVSVTELTNMDAKDRYVIEGIALSTATEDVGDGPQGNDNDTVDFKGYFPSSRKQKILLFKQIEIYFAKNELGFKRDLSEKGAHKNLDRPSLDPYSLSHLDPPTGSVYMIGGVLIAMVLVGVLIVLLAVTISKLRKREDHHSSASAVHPEVATVVQTATSPATIGTPATHPPADGCCTQMSTTTMSTDLGNSVCDEHIFAATTVTPSSNPVDSFAWQFPPPYPPPHMPPAQYALYNDQDTLVHALPSDRPGFAKGFRKNLGGRWRRLVKRKAETDTCAIPPELKDQLKTIYVY